MDSVGASKARTHLPRLLGRVARGESLTITRHGRPVARLVPVQWVNGQRVREAAERIGRRRQRLERAPRPQRCET